MDQIQEPAKNIPGAKHLATILDFKKGVAQYLWRHRSRAKNILETVEGLLTLHKYNGINLFLG